MERWWRSLGPLAGYLPVGAVSEVAGRQRLEKQLLTLSNTCPARPPRLRLFVVTEGGLYQREVALEEALGLQRELFCSQGQAHRVLAMCREDHSQSLSSTLCRT
jgi:hypothetical protein